MTNYYLGIEKAGDQLKISAFIKKGKVFKLHKLDRLNLSGDLAQGREVLSDWLKENTSKDAEVSAVLSVPESTLYLKEVTLPKVSRREIKEALYWEVAGSIPFPKDDLIFDWKILEDGKENIKALAICARESEIGEIIDLFEEFGVKVVSVEPTSVSFIRVTKADFERTTLLIAVEEKETNLSVLKGKAPVFTTSISTPITPEEKSKRRLSDTVIEDLATQAYKTIKFWEDKNNEKVKQVVITGDIAEKYYGLADAINKLTQVPTLMATKRNLAELVLKDKANSIQLRYMISIGAFCAFLEEQGGINLLPQDKKDLVNKADSRGKLHRSSLFLTLANFSLMFLFLMIFVVFTIWNRSLIQLEAQKEDQVSQHSGQKLISEVKKTNERAGIIDSLMNHQKNTGLRLDTISKANPKSVRLTAIDFGQLTNEEWVLSGIGSRDDILSYYDKLKDSDAKEVGMPYSNFSKEEENEFRITIIW